MTELKTYSNLMKAIRSGEFVISGELEPERTSNIEPTVHEDFGNQEILCCGEYYG